MSFFYSSSFLFTKTKFTVNDSIIISDVLLHSKSDYIGTTVTYDREQLYRYYRWVDGRGPLEIVKSLEISLGNRWRPRTIAVRCFMCADILLLCFNRTHYIIIWYEYIYIMWAHWKAFRSIAPVTSLHAVRDADLCAFIELKHPEKQREQPVF